MGNDIKNLIKNCAICAMKNNTILKKNRLCKLFQIILNKDI